MIKDFEIIFAAIVANIHQTGYGLVTPQACKSWATPDFVDRVLIIDGNSIDETASSIQNAAGIKCEIIKSSVTWSPDQWTWELLRVMENEIFEATSKLENPNKILIIQSTDTIYDEASLQELKSAILALIEDKDKDYVNLSFKKAITKDYVSHTYPYMPNWYISSISKFRKGIEWGQISLGESGISCNREISRLNFNFKNQPISYDMFCFEKKQIEMKIQRHVEFANKIKPTVDDYIIKWLNKLKNFGIYNFQSHPKEANFFLEKLTSEHFGYNLFGHVKDIGKK